MYLSITDTECRSRQLTADQVRDGHSQDRQPGRTHVRAGHDEHTQEGARRAQKAARRRLKGKG